MKYKFYTLKNLGDTRGSLIVLEKGNNVTFDIKRAFYIYGTKAGTVRGIHANKESEFLMMCVRGTCKVLVDDGTNKETFDLSRPDQALWLDKMVWKEMYDFSENAVLLVLSNQYYDEHEYIRDYESFLKMVS